jgi:hypothetical protein
MSSPALDPMEDFGSETEPARQDIGRPLEDPKPSKLDNSDGLVSRRGRWFVALAALAMLALAQVPALVLWALQSSEAMAAPMGTLVVETEPAGIEVRVDGALMGLSPLQVPVPAGRRDVQLRYDGMERSMSMRVAPGEVVRQSATFVRAASLPMETRLPAPPPPRPVSTPRPAPPGSLSGWVRVEVPIALRILEDGNLLGTTDVDRLMLPVGEHLLELRNDELGFVTRQTVKVVAGDTAVVAIRLPSAPISINAKPWAEAWVDGDRVGDTPIGTLMRSIGRHEVVLRHPELGERRESVLVTLGQPARVSVDFRVGK